MEKAKYLVALFLAACQSSPSLKLAKSLPSPAEAIPTVPASSDHMAWSLFPLSLTGGLAILAGIVAMIVYPGASGKRALILGILISLVPPLFLALEASLLVPVSLAVLVVGGAMLVFYLARSWERRRNPGESLCVSCPARDSV